MSGHTPGPWTVELPEPGMLCRQDTYVRANQWGAVALCSIDFSLPYCVEQQKANARLIAAAPELLAEIERQIEWSYNPFEPNNQSSGYYRMIALRDKVKGTTP